MKSCLTITSLPWLLILLAASESYAETVPFAAERWVIDAAEHQWVEHLGRPSLILKGGVAWVADRELTDGVLEFDVAFSGERDFVGGFWRMQDRGNYEDFYLRPHQSGNPDANQYTPVFNGRSGWQLYHGDGYAIPVQYPTNTWIHIKIVFSGKHGEIYIDSEEPNLAIEMKHKIKAGKLGVSSSNFAPAHFSRFQFRELEGMALTRSPPEPKAPLAGTVRAWSVSSSFSETALDGNTSLDLPLEKDLTWQTLAAEASGITNLARVATWSQEANTVFARLVVHAERAGIKRLHFGYSDRVKVYLDGRLIYGGDNTYRTRDYRYLGTLGLFDELYLDLGQGRHELLLAVSESFGGWGVQAVFDDPAGLRFEP